jgi:hypothetical protein
VYFRKLTRSICNAGDKRGEPIQAKIVREDQAEDLRNTLEHDYQAFIQSDRKRWLSTDDRHEIRQALVRSMKSAQEAVRIIDEQPGIGVNLQSLRGKLVILATMAEGDLKDPTTLQR